MVGVAARVALVQVPWLTLEEEPSPDLTSHIAGLEAMLSEMQQRVRQSLRRKHIEHNRDRWSTYTWRYVVLFCGEHRAVFLIVWFLLQVPVPFWSVEATQPAWAEANGEVEELDASLEDLMEVDVASNNKNKLAVCCQPPCCGLGCIG